MKLSDFSEFFALKPESITFIEKHGFDQVAERLEDIPESLLDENILNELGKLRRAENTDLILRAASELRENKFLLAVYNFLCYYWLERKDIDMSGSLLPHFEENAAGEENSGVYYLLVALAFFKKIEEVYAGLGLPEKYARDTEQYISGAIDEYASGHDGKLGFSERKLHWLRHYIDGKLFRIGRLEYMIQDVAGYLPVVYRRNSDGKVIALCRDGWKLRKDGYLQFVFESLNDVYKVAEIHCDANSISGIPLNPAGWAEVDSTITLDLSEYTPLWSPWDLVPGIHIPGGGGMKIDAVRDSLLEAREFFPKYFNRQVPAFCCASWIFNNDFEEELPNSNLANFMREVYLMPFPSYGVEGLQFVFGKSEYNNNWAHFPADNSLRLAFHRIRESGKFLKCGAMFIEARGLENFGQQIYRKDYAEF